ncbi:MAG: hypothetical protein GY941_27715 [Planctomycetes bacterium]|nr:hypothetical protein [Planctomycetota bacterium]
MTKKNAVNKRADAERACEHYAHEIMYCKRTVRAVRTQWQRQDMFASDVLGKRADGRLVALQVTAGQSAAVTARRRKLEREIWHPLDTVQLLQLVSTNNPGRGARKLWFFRVHEYQRPEGVKANCWVTWPGAVPVPREWFKAFKE